MNKSELHVVCPVCGADHTAGNQCDCQQIQIDLAQMPKHETEQLSRATFQAVIKAFKDPAVQAEYDEWRKKRNK